MSQKQYHTIRSIKKASEQKGTYGTMQNYALSIDTCGEPVKLSMAVPVTQEPKTGDRLYGWLSEHTAGDRTYMELNLAEKPKPTMDERIKAQWAIGQAVQCYLGSDQSHEAYENIVNEAKHFYHMVEEVIGE